MIVQRFGNFVRPVGRPLGLGLGVGLGLGLAVWLVAPSPVTALQDPEQIITGGQTTADGNTRYLGPGTLFNASIDFPSTGTGETAVSLPMFAGTVRALKVNLTTQTAPTAGTFTLRVRKNGANTSLVCTMTESGICTDGGAVKFNANDLLSIQAVNTLADSGTSVFTYVIRFQ